MMMESSMKRGVSTKQKEQAFDLSRKSITYDNYHIQKGLYIP